MIILGIDPGSRITGYGLVKKQGGNFIHLDNGSICCEKAPTFNDRLLILFEHTHKLIHTFKPDFVAVENIFYAKNVKSTVKLGHARGAILVACATAKLAIFEYTPLEVKQAIVGYGNASKEQVQKMVKAILHLPQIAEENASDALAVALCHAQSEKLGRIMSRVGQKARRHSRWTEAQINASAVRSSDRRLSTVD